MGHDITGYNKAGEEIAYARFSKGNDNATILYSLLDANEFDGGVSGTGNVSVFQINQIEEALNTYKRIYRNVDYSLAHTNGEIWDQKQILNFLENCLVTAQIDGNVRVFFC
ncbi:hypothetical protein SM124_16410 [Bacillus sp. 31A1R]|uniref:Uncharacterized protein n=1 Tax=Robertmurraya mangrovi TaxID=3098077 RepID=A0ABU5J1S7_9BACI|nr:hypothetical protein [Bacillus sp. 31A1R]MDZ5473302.1 hypothetical protein [Bacillus sp. 31A1R]